jgi:hypothetical protein
MADPESTDPDNTGNRQETAEEAARRELRRVAKVKGYIALLTDPTPT